MVDPIKQELLVASRYSEFGVVQELATKALDYIDDESAKLEAVNKIIERICVIAEMKDKGKELADYVETIKAIKELTCVNSMVSAKV